MGACVLIILSLPPSVSEEQTETDKTHENDDALPGDLDMEGEEREGEGEEEEGEVSM